MVLEEVTRNQTPTSQAIADWAKVNDLQVLPTKTLAHPKHLQASEGAAAKVEPRRTRHSGGHE
jgi:hypothetical protein